jgi:uncharacterized protein (DUF1501 family)
MNQLSRRRFAQQLVAPTLALAGLGSFAAPAQAAAARDRRFVLIVLRGGMDGLGAVPAVGDPDFAAARGPLAVFGGAVLPLASTPFALHPALQHLYSLYVQGEAAVVHATGLPYRERSHFDAQQVLESGGSKPYEVTTGWLARALHPGRQRAIAINTALPLVLRGPGEVDTWAPSQLPEPSADLVARLERLYAGDPALAQALARARGLRSDMAMAGGGMANASPGGGRTAAVGVAKKAAEFLLDPKGAQVAVLEMNGWDTHANQAAPNGALANNLRTLDAVIASLHETLAAPDAQGAWSRTVVLAVTEFGREVAINGTLGTDHGSGGAALLAGGAIRGGRGGQVIADWPGLAKAQRFEGRDLRITTDLRSVFKAVLGDHLGVASDVIEREAFPGSAGVKALNLLRT